MKLRNLIIIIAILSSFSVKAQIDATNANLIEYQLETYFNDFITSKIGTETVMSYQSIDGDPYIYKDFEKGSIKFEKDKNIVGKLRYNMYTDEIEFMYRNNVLILVYEDSFSGIRLGDYNIIQMKYPHDNEKNKPGYFIQLTKGSYNLLCKKSVAFLEAEKPKLYGESKPGRFAKNPDKFYLINSDQSLFEIKNISKLKSFSPEMSALVDEYVAGNKLRINNKHLTHFFKWVNAK